MSKSRRHRSEDVLHGSDTAKKKFPRVHEPDSDKVVVFSYFESATPSPILGTSELNEVQNRSMSSPVDKANSYLMQPPTRKNSCFARETV